MKVLRHIVQEFDQESKNNAFRNISTKVDASFKVFKDSVSGFISHYSIKLEPIQYFVYEV